MAMLIAIALHHRDHFSHGKARQTFGNEAYHWTINITPEANQSHGCSFEATDATTIDPVTFRMTNPTMDWWFRHEEDVNLTSSPKLLGSVVIGEVADNMSSAQFRDFFARVRLPAKNTHPQQSCVTWVADAICALQERGWVTKFDIDQFKCWALSYADERMKGMASTEPIVKYYSI
ncbi:serine threonine protein kinase [Ophiocordyceps camponoti-floridani]|uniref:Serine threonine protein kinase n=1 Tax=Ophiocordyceps camponoti-floridani TaxID=2030778 RepID=A0A8H4Q5G2_9HYPO|nr:serine threonine protein kinase [Ophiocordyceps camponoti-floridani]